jgi:hypothetical protein
VASLRNNPLLENTTVLPSGDQIGLASDPKGRVAKLVQFLQNEFHVYAGLPKEQYPGLPLLMSLLDMALDRKELFDNGWGVNVVAELREAIELGIFDVLEESLMKSPTTITSLSWGSCSRRRRRRTSLRPNTI